MAKKIKKKAELPIIVNPEGTSAVLPLGQLISTLVSSGAINTIDDLWVGCNLIPGENDRLLTGLARLVEGNNPRFLTMKMETPLPMQADLSHWKPESLN